MKLNGQEVYSKQDVNKICGPNKNNRLGNYASKNGTKSSFATDRTGKSQNVFCKDVQKLMNESAKGKNDLKLLQNTEKSFKWIVLFVLILFLMPWIIDIIRVLIYYLRFVL